MSTAINTSESEDENTKKKRSVNHRKQHDGNEIFQTNFLLFPRIRLNTVQLCFPLSEVSLRRKKKFN